VKDHHAGPTIRFVSHLADAPGVAAAVGAAAADWFRRRFGEPTVGQRLAWPALAAGGNVLLSAPTGGGKTLAAFLPILGRLLDPTSQPHAASVHCVYVAPLKALCNDVARNVSLYIDELMMFAHPGAPRPRLAVRTGDTPAAERLVFRRDPPEILLTTPESLAVLLSQPAAEGQFAGLRWVVVDEVHAFAPTKRGADLALSLERLTALAAGDVQRIGLSATAEPLDEAARFLVGAGRTSSIARAVESATIQIDVAPLTGGPGFLSALTTRLAPELRAVRGTLVFTNTRRLAERLAWVLRRRMPDWDDRIAVHHSSVAAAGRREVEERFKRGELRVVVNSTSLELGIDVGAVDLVALVHPPGGVVRLMQRVGRAGHGPGRVKRGLVFTAHPSELLEAVVTGASGAAAQCEPLRVPDHPLDVLCQHLAGMAAARPQPRDEAYALVRRAYPYRDLTRRDFDDCVAYLLGLDRGGRPWLPPRVAEGSDGLSILDRRTARWLRGNLGTIHVEEKTTVWIPFSREPQASADADWREVGDVDDAFAEHLQPGDRFLLDGRCLEFRRRDGPAVLTEEVVGLPTPPRWGGDGWPLSADLAQRLFVLRIQAVEALREGPAALAMLFRRQYGLGDEPAAALSAYFQRQEAVSEVPDGLGLLVEAVRSSYGVEYYLHTPLNRTANDALARVAVRRLVRDCGRSAEPVVADLGFALRLRGELDDPSAAVRVLLRPDGFSEELEAALADGPTLRERFARVARTGLMLLRQPFRRRRRVGGRDWAERRLFDQVQCHDPDFVLLRQATCEIAVEACDGQAAIGYVGALERLPIRVRRLTRPSPFVEAWTQAADGPDESVETPAEALRRLHEILMREAG
jgi:ATP-dependent Lhr-like helicase